MKKLALAIMMVVVMAGLGNAVANIGSKWVGGDLVYIDANTGENIATFNATDDSLEISSVEIAAFNYDVTGNSYVGSPNYYINVTVDLDGTPTTARLLLYIP